jgi:hypothetical protein
MRVLVYGGRTYKNKTRLFAELDAIHRETPISVIIHGAATGADSLGKWWAEQQGIPDEPYPANWSDMQAERVAPRKRRDGTWYNAAAGNIRNLEMMRKGKPDIAVEFKGNRGTDDMRWIVLNEMKKRPLQHIVVSEEPWTLVRVVAPHFVAGLETDGQTIRRAAPIIKYLIGKSEDEARAYIQQMGWRATLVGPRV